MEPLAERNSPSFIGVSTPSDKKKEIIIISKKKPIEIPSGVEATLKEGTIEVKGALGSRYFDFSEKLNVSIVDNSITVTPKSLEKETRQLWGMSRSQIANIVNGVSAGFSKELEINGVGYRAAVQGKVLKLSLGYSHDVDFDIPDLSLIHI